jgi:hypothetical protein
MSEREYQPEREPIVRVEVGHLAIGIGLLSIGIGVFAIADYFSKRKLIDEYITEARAYREALIRAYEDGVVDESEQKFLNDLQNSLSRKEKAIEAAGLGHELVKALQATFGVIIAYTAYKVTSRLVDYWVRKYRPPKWKCPLDGKVFDSEEELRRHLEEDHKATTDTSKYDALVDALAETPDWFKGIVADALGWTFEQVENIKQWWDTLPPEQKIVIGVAIAIVILLIAALAGWFGFVAEIGVVFARAAACLM